MAQTVLVTRPEDVRDYGRNAATLLGQIDFWSKKVTSPHPCVVRRDGYVWIAKSREVWCEEIALTFKQLKTVLSVLTRLGVLISERHLHHNRVTAFLRIEEDVRNQGKKGPIDKALEGPNDRHQKGPNSWAPEGPNIYLEKEKEKNISVGFATPPISEKKNKIRKGQKVPNPVCGVAEIPSDKTWIKKLDTDRNKGSKPGQLELAFKTAWSETYPGEYLTPMTSKQLGQLKQFAAASPPGQASKVIDWCVRNWSIFTSFAEYNHGAFKSPKRPTVGYLLQNVQSAVNGSKEHTQTPEKPSMPQKQVFQLLSAPEPPQPPQPIDPDDLPMTLDELKKHMFPECDD